jgi:hypothetical protein
MITLDLDLRAILDLQQELKPQLLDQLQKAAKDLALQSHAHLLENVQSKLHSSREKYLAALDFKQVSDDTWIINLGQEALWIEEGMEEHSMLPDLLASPKAKMSADGSRYICVPFEHNKGPSRQTQAQNDLTSTIKAEMKARKIPYGNLEKDANGNTKTGLLHKFDIAAPMKTSEGPGQGHGPIGAPRQGSTGIPFLQNVRVYQKEIKDASTGKSAYKKSIMTFRVASSKHPDKWRHPGVEARHLMDETAEWALQQWETKIAPSILKSF